MPTLAGGRERLAQRAFTLKKAWLLVSFMVGQALTAQESTIPGYANWTRRQLQEQCTDLERDLEEVLALVVVSPRQALRPGALKWLVEQFDRWHASGLGLFTISTAKQFENQIGVLEARRRLEIPPYAELLLQPGIGVAFRHPEYMLVRDLGMLYDLYCDAEGICERISWRNPPSWAATAGENTQALARATIQACFNLLESFVSGLARAHIMNHEVEPHLYKRLTENREPLKKRIRQIPALIVGRDCPISVDAYPMGPLFNDVKSRRDAFVHCEPGPQQSSHGYVKESVFHDVSPELVTLAVKATHELIREVWGFVYAEEGPRWLPPLEESGRFGKINLALGPRT